MKNDIVKYLKEWAGEVADDEGGYELMLAADEITKLRDCIRALLDFNITYMPDGEIRFKPTPNHTNSFVLIKRIREIAGLSSAMEGKS